MDKKQLTQDEKERRIQELIDALPVLTPEEEALFNAHGDLIEKLESPSSGTTGQKTNSSRST